MDLKVGFIGAGHIANKMADCIRQLDGFTNYAVASKTKEKLKDFKSKYGFIKCYDNYEDLVKDPDVDIIYISTINTLHYDNCLLALKYNKPVICEKPLTINESLTKDLYKKFREKNILLVEALWSSFLPYNKVLNELIFTDKIIGNVLSITANFKLDLINVERIKEKNLGGGALLDLGIYPMSFIFRLLGANYINYEVTKCEYINGIDSNSTIIFNYPNNIKAIMNSSVVSPSDGTVSIIGDKGRVEIDSVTCPSSIDVYDLKNNVILKKDTTPKINGFEYEMESFKNSLNKKRIVVDEHTPEDSIRISKIITPIIE